MTGMLRRRSTEGVCGNNAVRFQSCDVCSYCTALGQNGCTDIVSRQLRDSSGYQISVEGDPEKETWIADETLRFYRKMHDRVQPMSHDNPIRQCTCISYRDCLLEFAWILVLSLVWQVF